MKYLLSCHWLCALVGCNEDTYPYQFGHPGCCQRCGLCIYDYGYVEPQYSLLHFIPSTLSKVNRWFMMLVSEHYCEVCNKRLNRKQEFVCDNKVCQQNWVPF